MSPGNGSAATPELARPSNTLVLTWGVALRSLRASVAVASLLAVTGPASAQSPFAPATGPYPVGTLRLLMVDSARAELSSADREVPRRLIVQVWYPAAPQVGTLRAPYVPEFRELAQDLGEGYPTLALDTLQASAWWDAPPLSARRFPLVVFSHGMNSARYFYTGLLQDLASHGFIVAAIDHPFWSLAAAFGDRGRLSLAESMVSRDQLTSDEIDGFMQDGVALMAEDQAFVASRLPAAAPRLHPAIDHRRIGVMGHSMGGMAATLSCWRYRLFSACASLDGLVWAREGLSPVGEPPNRVAKPFLLLLSSQFLPRDLSTAVRRYRRAWRDPSLCLVPGTRHNSVTDLPQLRGTAPNPGDLDAAVAASVIRGSVAGFFGVVLAGRPAPPALADSTIRRLPGDTVPATRSFAQLPAYGCLAFTSPRLD